MEVSELIIKDERVDLDYDHSTATTENANFGHHQRESEPDIISGTGSTGESSSGAGNAFVPWKIIKREKAAHNQNNSVNQDTFNSPGPSSSQNHSDDDSIPVYVISETDPLVPDIGIPIPKKKPPPFQLRIGKKSPYECRQCGKTFQFNSQLLQHQANSHENSKLFKITNPSLDPTNPCDVCSKKFKTPTALALHRRSHFRVKITICKICGLEFNDSNLFQAHKLTHSAVIVQKDGVSCEICGKKVAGAAQLAKHKKIHSKTYPCNFCELIFQNFEDLTSHKIIHKSVNVCTICGESVLGFKEFQIHKRSHDPDPELSPEQFSCKICSIDFENLEQSKEHKNKHVAENFACNICGQKFKGVGPLWNHTKMHRRAQEHSCPFCPLKFLNFKEFQIHEKTHSNNEEVFSCSICGKVVKGAGPLTQHKKIHFREEYDCPECGEKVRGSLQIVKHKRRHERSMVASSSPVGDQDVKCVSCPDLTFSSSTDLKAHRTEEHNGVHSCHICGKVVTGSGQLVQHLKSHQNSKPRTCPICGKHFKFTSPMEAHLKSHFRPLKMYTCDGDRECRLTFNSSLALKIHKKTDHAIDKKYTCEICGKVVSGSGQLVQHKKMHTDGKVRDCIFCGKKFRFACLLYQHLKIHSKPDRVYTCGPCNQTFTSFTDYRQHRKTHVGVDDKIHTCQICSKSFSFASLLRVHLSRHNKFTHKRHYKCDICNRILKGPAQLIMHKKSHDKVFPCKLCDGTFQTYDLLQEHRSTHAAEEYICDICGKEVTGPGQLAQHKKSHSTIHKCQTCELEFSSALTLIEHRKSVHRTRNICTICGEIIMGTKEFAAHKKIHIILTHSCKICSIEFETAEESEEHKKIHVAANFGCDVCGLDGFKGFGPLAAHKKMHRRTEIYSCEECDQTFKYAQELVEHKKIHKEILEYSCDICKKVVSGASQLAQHRKSHFRAQYTCKVCGQVISGLAQISAHKNKHGDDGLDDGDVTFVPSGNSECTECGKTFKFPSLLVRHMESHTKPKPVIPPRLDLKCSECPDMTFTSRRKYVAHRKEHNIGRVLECKDCGKILSGQGAYSQHIKSHNPTLKTCPECGRVFKYAYMLTVHLKSHLKPQRVYNCTECDATFTQSRTFRIHKGIHNSTKVHECDVCGKVLNGAGALAQHKKTHDETKLCSCIFCGKAFKFASTLLKHLEIHSKPEREYPCRNCDEIFTNFLEYRAHRRTHLNDKSHSCEICGKAFRFASSLRGHMKTHLNKNRYFCGDCDQNFEFVHELKNHRKMEHATLKTYECDICGKICSGASPLIMHKKMHKRARFKCDVCGRVLKGAQQLVMHKRSHDPNKVHRCRLCPLTFETDDLLQAHKSTHGAEEYICDICGKELTGPGQLTQHKKAHSTVHKCNTCDATFSYALELQEHKKIHRAAHTCDICGESVVGLRDFQSHKRSHIAITHSCRICSIDFETAEQSEEHKKTHTANNFKCDVCGLNFKGFGPLLAHRKMHRRTESYSCDKCSETFKYAQELTEHKKSHKSEVEEYSCKICGKEVTGPSQLIQHKKTHFRVVYNCKICGEKVTGSSQISLHKKSHKKEPNLSESDLDDDEDEDFKYEPLVSLECPEPGCGKTFKFPSILRRHMQVHGKVERKQSTDEKNWECEICGKTLKGPGQLAQHIKSHDPSTRSCPICGKVFKYVSIMAVHLKTHSRQQKIYKCEECGETLKNSVAWRIHKKSHASGKTHECDICGKVVSGSGQLVRHMKFHTEGKARTCLFCGKTFRFACFLVTHLKVHSKPERLYTCTSEGCDLTFKTSAEFKEHRKIHSDVTNDDIPKIHSCEICGKSFQFACLLKVHSKIHLDRGNKFFCRDCDRTFEFAHELRNHRKIHATQTTLDCDVCGKTFGGRTGLIMHKKMHQRARYKCDICERVLKGSQQLAMHRKSHDTKKPGKVFPCKLCDETFETNDLLQEHRSTHVAEEYICDICGKEVTGPGQLAQHKKSHSTIHKCKTCSMECTSWNELKEHRKIAHPTTNTCDVCGETVIGVKEFVSHKKSHIILTHSCRICSIDFETGEESDEHKKIHIEANFKCDVCGLKGFKGFGPLLGHVKMHRRTETYSCEECGKTFKYAQEVTEHHRKEHKEVQEYSCDICGKEVTGPGPLIQHKKMHTKPTFKCRVCGDLLNSRSQLTAHHKKVHEKKKKSNHPCRACGKIYKFKYLVDKHELKCSKFERKRSSDDLNPKKVIVHFVSLLLPFIYKGLLRRIPKHVCPICESIFDHAHELRMHSITLHKIGGPVFTCRTCGKTFNRPLEFMNHKKLHSSPKHVCFCGMGFSVLALLKAHQRVTHPSPRVEPLVPQVVESVPVPVPAPSIHDTPEQ